MSYFFSEQNLSSGVEINMAGEEARHILLSRRIKSGQKINLQGPNGQRFLVEVTGADKKSVRLKILSSITVPQELSVLLTLFLSVISEAALDFVLQKGTELGLGKLILFDSANTATKLTQDVFKKKKLRWEKIVREAAKQSDRAVWPKIEFITGVDEVKQELANYDKIILFNIVGKSLSLTDKLPSIKSLAMIVGPEGGLTDQEIDLFKSLPKIELVTLGPVLLRADTACLAGLSAVRLLTN